MPTVVTRYGSSVATSAVMASRSVPPLRGCATGLEAALAAGCVAVAAGGGAAAVGGAGLAAGGAVAGATVGRGGGLLGRSAGREQSQASARDKEAKGRSAAEYVTRSYECVHAIFPKGRDSTDSVGIEHVLDGIWMGGSREGQRE